MQTVKVHPTAQQFLDTAQALEQRELHNNMILGTCNNVADKTLPLTNHYFVSAGIQPSVFSIRTFPKVIVAGTEQHTEAVKSITDYYIQHSIPLAGVIGECFYADTFADNYNRPVKRARTTHVQGLTQVNTLALAQGSFAPCHEEDLDTLHAWCQQFLKDEQLLPRSDDDMSLFLRYHLSHKHLFGWYHHGQLVSMACIIRKTKNTATIGFVYTPPVLRGKGYAQSCTHGISQNILQAGFTHSGLLVYEHNANAQHVYAKLGYKTVTSYTDVDFDTKPLPA